MDDGEEVLKDGEFENDSDDNGDGAGEGDLSDCEM